MKRLMEDEIEGVGAENWSCWKGAKRGFRLVLQLQLCLVWVLDGIGCNSLSNHSFYPLSLPNSIQPQRIILNLLPQDISGSITQFDLLWFESWEVDQNWCIIMRTR